MSRPNDLAIVSCYFNPCEAESRRRNLSTFLEGMRAHKLPVFVGELVFPNQRYLLPESEGTVSAVRFSAHDVMWHKERLINLIVERLPSQYTKVAWVDADVTFPDETWYAKASTLLDHLQLVQLFEQVSQLNNDGIEIRRLSGLAMHVALARPRPFKFDTSDTWPGLAWACQRRLLDTHGLFDVMILGGGDTYMSLAAYGRLDESYDWHVQRLAPKLRKAWRGWAKPFFSDVRGDVGFVPTSIVQLGHGRTENRRYVERLGILSKYDFDPMTDITSGPLGIWEWSSMKLRLHAEVRAYFRQRDEDTGEL
jgi:hypothetical protein